MRSRSCWMGSVAMASLVLVALHAASALGCPRCGLGAAYAAPACAAPGFGMTPGCCECPPSCCDHVWDGYCQHKGCRRRCVDATVVVEPLCGVCQPEAVGPKVPGSVLDLLAAPPPGIEAPAAAKPDPGAISPPKP